MGEEMGGRPIGTDWKKAISAGRDRLQSRVLVAVVGTLLVLLSCETLYQMLRMAGCFAVFVFGIIGISVAFAAAVRVLRAATPMGAICGGMICLLITFWTGSYREQVFRSGLTSLFVLFVLTFLATRAGRQRKSRAGLAEERRGRSASQVIANLSMAALSASSLTFCCAAGVMKVMCVAVLVEATADTVSSEIGQAFGGQAVMFLSMRRVAPGTDGGVTLLGTSAGIGAGAIVALAGMWAMHLGAPGVGIAFGTGACGLFFDSLLGATVERRGWMGNDLVNFLSTVFAAGLAGVLYRYIAF
jgi:uncharacterized protein (TIGR00297 family)